MTIQKIRKVLTLVEKSSFLGGDLEEPEEIVCNVFLMRSNSLLITDEL